MPDPIAFDATACRPAICLRPGQLIGAVCRKGGLDCPILSAEDAGAFLERAGADPTALIRLETPADRITHHRAMTDADWAATNPAEVLNRSRDLHVLQRLGLGPGDARFARYLYELLFSRIETPIGICCHDTPGWEGCELARSGVYEAVREKGWSEIVQSRTREEMDEARRQSALHIERDGRLFVRPHHFMCLSCWWNGGEPGGPRGNDTLTEIRERIVGEPDVPVTLVEGNCDACDCCDGFDPATTRCTHSCGLVRDFKKDLDVFEACGLMPGATLPAREFLALLFERVLSTTQICGNGTGEPSSHEWLVCGGPQGNQGYVRTRETGLI